ncbi:MAG: glycosyltransferase family 2 protein [Magnetococcales bacterium]|nr:glycosyltransferase family 2 protein [Magnetococcales bacterium]
MVDDKANIKGSRITRVIVIIPAHNEEESIVQTINSLKSLRSDWQNHRLEFNILVVDDGSQDRTSDLASEAGVDQVIRHHVNLGLGAAIRSGLTFAETGDFDIAVKFDADLQHDPEDILPLITPILENKADIVYGNRHQRIDYVMPLVRRWGNAAFTGLMRWLTRWPLEDSQPGIIALGRDYLHCFYLPGDYNYTQQILVDSYRKGMRFAHVPVSFRKRTTGRSFISLKYPFKVLPQIFLVLVAVKPLRVFGPLGGFFLGAGGLLFLVEFIHFLLGEYERPVQHVFLVLGLLLFGLQTLFFGVLAHLIVDPGRRR